MSTRADHVVAKGMFRCLHCNLAHAFPDIEMPIETHISVVRGFALMHKHCQKRPEPSPQLDMPYADTVRERPVELRCCDRSRAGQDCDCAEDLARMGELQDARYANRAATTIEPDERPYDQPDDPDPEHGKPELVDVFAKLYPSARTHSALRDYLFEALGAELYDRLATGTVETWHPDTGIFQGIAHWARVEKAHQDSEARAKAGEGGIPGLYLPARQEMPEPLREALGLPASKPKGKRGARPLTSARKGKA